MKICSGKHCVPDTLAIRGVRPSAAKLSFRVSILSSNFKLSGPDPKVCFETGHEASLNVNVLRSSKLFGP